MSDQGQFTQSRSTSLALMAMVAAFAGSTSLFAVGARFARTDSAMLPSILAFNLSALLPALWLGAITRNRIQGLILRFAIGSIFLGSLFLSVRPADFERLIPVAFLLLIAGLLVPSIAWYLVSLSVPSGRQDRIRRALISLTGYLLQLVLTFCLALAVAASISRLI